MIRNLLLVGVGGGFGSILRWLVQKWFATYFPHSFPWGTFAVNSLGCLLIGIFWGLLFRSNSLTADWQLLLMTGFCGGFTTFSAFTLEGINLLRENKTGVFSMYVATSVIIGLISTFAGIKLSR
jgi:CrcB protein